VEGGFIENNARELASFFKNTPTVDKARIGEYIGQRFFDLFIFVILTLL